MAHPPEPAAAPPSTQATAEHLLQVVGEVVEELHPHRRGEVAVGLDDSLERDWGFDSLGRVELLFRLEETFAVTLPDAVLASAETARDLLRAVTSGAGATGGAPAPEVERISLARAEGAPQQAATLPEVLDWHLNAHPDRLHVSFLGEGDETEPMTYGALAAAAERVAAGLQALGVKPGEAVAIMLPTGPGYFHAFYGVLLAGAVPAPIYPPFRPSQIEEHLRRHTTILANALAPVLITLPEAGAVGGWLSAQVETLRTVTTVADLQASGGKLARPKTGPGETALLQYTSGSTGNPKGVVLTHANLLANIRVMGRAIRVDSSDIFVSWLPLYHDMGLIGACLATMYHAVPVVLMSPLAFMARPERWLRAIHRHRATLSGGVNYAYELCVSKIRDRNLEGLDLRSWRFAFNGAEPISPQTLAAFQKRFGPHGFQPQAMAPVYGLAECSVGLAFPPKGRAPLLHRVRRERFLRDGVAETAADDDPTGLTFVACGQPLPGHQLRVVDDGGQEAPEGKTGRLQFKGPSATSGYFRNAEATRELFDGEWLETGDVAYMREGDVYLTSRVKDVIIRAGRNLYPYELEDAIGDLEGIRKGCVAIFGSAKEGEGTERLVVVAETRIRDPERRREMARGIEERGLALVGTPPDDVVLAPPHSVLKTSSGKIRRAAVRDLYERGLIGAGAAGGRRRMLRLALGLVLPRLRRMRRHLGERAYGLYAYAVLGLVGLLAWPLVAVLPRTAWAWAVTRAATRAILALARIRVRVQGLENVPPGGPFVVVANHSSYLDVLVLAARFPADLSFVAKGELVNHFFSRIFLRRVGCEFVERFDSARSAEDARRLTARLAGGRPMMFFPEGTFTRAAGLYAFHLGAFTAAAEAGAPVVPVSLRGTRSLLRDGTWLPRRGAVSVSISPPIAPVGQDWRAAVALRDAAREAVLRHCGEPDVAAQSEGGGFLAPPGGVGRED